MVFSSIIFIFYYLPICILVYALLPKVSLKNLWLLICSLGFYYWGENNYILILLMSILGNYCFGLLISRNSRGGLVLGLVFNVMLLVYYKYAGFLYSNFETLSGFHNLGFSSLKHIHLPLGISFFTFQGMSYLIDIYRKEAKVETNLFNLALYISMFPQLVAGPIVRFKTIAKEIRTRVVTLSKFSHGITLFIIGLGYKVLIANKMGTLTDDIFDLSNDQLTTLVAWAGTLSYTIQIYFDFCGYSVMAIGIGLMMGFHFPINFNYPYISSSITEFWRRWHITLSSWFRDYLYIPLGGNRVSNRKLYRNLLIVFCVTGFWHGAAWTFVIWGLYHGLFLIIERNGFKNILSKFKIVAHIYTLFIVVVGWTLFRANDMSQFFAFCKNMFLIRPGRENAINHYEIFSNLNIMTFIVGIILATPLVNKIFYINNSKNNLSTNQEFSSPKLPYVWYPCLLLVFILSTSSLMSSTYNPFIYFRF